MSDEKSNSSDNEFNETEELLLKNAREVLLAAVEAWDWERKQKRLKKVLDSLGVQEDN